MQELILMDNESLLLKTTINRLSKDGSIYSNESKNCFEDWVEKVGSQKTVILTCKQNQTSSKFDHAIPSAEAAPQNNNSVVHKQTSFSRIKFMRTRRRK